MAVAARFHGMVVLACYGGVQLCGGATLAPLLLSLAYIYYPNQPFFLPYSSLLGMSCPVYMGIESLGVAYLVWATLRSRETAILAAWDLKLFLHFWGVLKIGLKMELTPLFV